MKKTENKVSLSKTQINQIAREIRKLKKEEEKEKQEQEAQKEKAKVLSEYKSLQEKPQEFYEQLLFEMFSIEYDHWDDNKKTIDWCCNEEVEEELEKDSMLWVCFNTDSDTFMELVNIRNEIWLFMRAKIYPDRYNLKLSKVREPEE